MLTFDETEHRYCWSGKPIPNVTRVLADLTDYSMVNPEALAIAQTKGLAVHKMVELYCKNDLDEAVLPEWLVPVLAKWKSFVSFTGFEVRESERRVFHPVYQYAGTLDLFGWMEHQTAYALIDLKRSFMAGKVINLQLAAYRGAYAEEVKHAKTARLFALRLNEKDPLRVQEYTDSAAFGEFLSLLTAQRIKQKYAH